MRGLAGYRTSWVTLTLLLAPVTVAHAAPAGKAEASPSAAAAEDKPKTGWAALPVATYTPETELGFGAFGTYFFRLGSASAHTRPSSLSVVLLYTLRNQWIAELIPQLHWDDERWHLWSRLDYRLYPNRVWAIGNDAPEDTEERFTEDRWRWQARFGRLLVSHLWLYAHTEVLTMELEDLAPRGLLARRALPGARGGLTFGIGPGVAWDSRDHLLVPRHGGFHEIVMMSWQDSLGSDYNFTELTVHLRQYLPIGETHALALQLYAKVQAGHVPFYKMAQLGGQELLRGYFAGRFRDKTLLALQAEYRFPLVWRLGAVAHAALGDVASSPQRLPITEPEWSVGGGLRLMLNRSERLNLRTDVGFGRDTYGIYVGVAEAF